MLTFTLKTTHNKARRGELKTAHSIIQTPVFMPVGTKATVKGILPETLHKIGFEIILANTYHLMLQPNADTIAEFGGLHKFANWGKSILTDSGGYQVMSLSSLRKITEEGVEFRSHIDGSKHFMSPEISVQIQHKLDSNITMVLDECIPYGSDLKYVEKSTARTTAWARRSKNAFINKDGYGIFGIIQGGTDEKLRQKSTQELIDIGFDGYAIGGLAIGEPQDTMFKVLDFTQNYMLKDKPRYLMGVGRPSDILGAIELGVDMFDCVLPTRAGRNAKAFTSLGEINIRNAQWKHNHEKLDNECNCTCCLNYTKGYLHHLFKADEMLGAILLTTHNLYFYNQLILGARRAIENSTYTQYKETILTKMVLDKKR